MKTNNKGFTLIEILVTLVITSIVMVVAGSIILNSFGYFNKTESADVNKFAVDKIADLIRDELAYASSVVVADEKPKAYGDWYALSLNSEKHLIKTTYVGDDASELLLYTDDFYNNNILELKARCYKNDYRMDLSFAFLDNNNKEIYKTSHTLELINLKNNVFSSNGASEDQYSELLNIVGTRRIFYQKGTNPFVNDTPTIDSSGTVADEIHCKNEAITALEDSASNNKGVWIENAWNNLGKQYVLGDFVQYPDKDGAWYRLEVATDAGSTRPDKSTNWKKISKDYSEASYYDYKDIIVYAGKYYQMIRTDGGASDVLPNNPAAYAVWKGPKDSAKDFIDLNDKETFPDYYNGCNLEKYQDTVNNKDDDPNLVIEEYKGNGHGSMNEFVKYNGAVWMTVQNGDGNIAPGEKNKKGEYDWQKIQLNWDETSGYLKGDIIRYDGKFYLAKKDDFVGTEPTDKSIWVEVKYEGNGNWTQA
ncbi:PilW family protein [Amedibacillus sp. YH-ame10]